MSEAGWIAERVTQAKEDGAEIRVRIFAPRLAAKRDWCCPYEIVCRGHTVERQAFGVDSYQALQLVFVMIEAHLESLGAEG